MYGCVSAEDARGPNSALQGQVVNNDAAWVRTCSTRSTSEYALKVT